MKKADVRDIASLEEYYAKVRKIKFADEVQIESIDDIYKNLFMTQYGSRDGQEPTYFVRGKLHCETRRHRSIDDFIKLCKRYFPDLTLKDIFQFLKEKQDTLDENGYRQALSYCSHIRKYNFKGLTVSKYAAPIQNYDLRDLNSNLEPMRVADLLT